MDGGDVYIPLCMLGFLNRHTLQFYEDENGDDCEEGVESDIKVRNIMVDGKDQVLEAALKYIKERS